MFRLLNCLVIIFVINTAAATISQADSLKSTNSQEETGYKIHLSPWSNSHKIFLGEKEFQIQLDNPLLEMQTENESSNPASIAELKLKLNDYLKERRNSLPNYDLGEFGKYLGYANAFAAILLAIAHISKYGFK